MTYIHKHQNLWDNSTSSSVCLPALVYIKTNNELFLPLLLINIVLATADNVPRFAASAYHTYPTYAYHAPAPYDESAIYIKTCKNTHLKNIK